MAQAPIDDFREFLARKGLRLTAERSVVVEVVFATDQTFDVEYLFRQLPNRVTGRRVSRSTVYRTIALLDDSGLIQKVSGDGQWYSHEYTAYTSDRFPQSQPSPLCPKVHINLIAGICPWCGRAILHGRPTEGSP